VEARLSRKMVARTLSSWQQPVPQAKLRSPERHIQAVNYIPKQKMAAFEEIPRVK